MGKFLIKAASHGQIIGTSEMYESASVKSNATNASVVVE